MEGPRVDEHGAGGAPTGPTTRLLAPLAERISGVHAGAHPARDPELISRAIGPISVLTSYFSPEINGLERLPASGPVLVIGNHSCLFYMPDVWVVGQAIVARRGLSQPAYAMGYDLLFAVPVVGSFLSRIGVLPATHDEAESALSHGAALLVYPGGDWEACRPWVDRNRVCFGGHLGFIKLALKTGVPVIPVVTHGSHDAVVVVTRGDKLARVLGLPHLRVKVFPLALGPPFGLTSMLLPPLPLPSAISIEFLPALDWSRFGPEAAGDEDAVAECYAEITDLMQDALTRLHRQHPHPVARGISRLVRRGLTGSLFAPVGVPQALHPGPDGRSVRVDERPQRLAQ